MKNTFLVAIIFLSGSIFSTENCLEIKDENAQLECITQEALAPKDSSWKKRIESDPDIAKLIKQRELEKKQREREELRKAKELEQIASERRKAQEKYDKIYNACILDKSDGVDIIREQFFHNRAAKTRPACLRYDLFLKPLKRECRCYPFQGLAHSMLA